MWFKRIVCKLLGHKIESYMYAQWSLCGGAPEPMQGYFCARCEKDFD